MKFKKLKHSYENTIYSDANPQIKPDDKSIKKVVINRNNQQDVNYNSTQEYTNELNIKLGGHFLC
jgi:hypothetical protein